MIKIYFLLKGEFKMKKTNNKGFSLVELIVVIAIMAVLVGVLAPTYLQYVEKTKKSNDVSTVDSIVNAIEIAAIDPEVHATNWTTLKVEIKGSGVTFTKGASDDAKMEDAVKEIVGDTTDIKLKSTKWDATAGTSQKVEFTATNTGGKVTFKYGTDNGSKEFAKYATSITKIANS